MLQNHQRLITNVLISLILIIGLSACSTQPKSVVYTPEPINRPELVLPETQELDLEKVDWILITPENVDEQFELIRKSGKPVVFFALNNDGYQALSLDMANILKLITQQKAIIVAYENYYEKLDIELETNQSPIVIEVEENEGFTGRLRGLFK